MAARSPIASASLHLPAGRSAERVRDALVATVQTLPGHARRSLTWVQGAEMAAHGSLPVAIDVLVYFCDPGRAKGRFIPMCPK